MVVVARYNRLSEQYWLRARDWDDKARTLGAYLHTCRHSTGEGYYVLPVAYMAEDMKWTPAHVRKALSVLQAAGEIHYDEPNGVVFVPESLEIQTPTTDKQVQGAMTRIHTVPVGRLLGVFYKHAVTHAEKLAESIRAELGTEVNESMAMESDFHSNGNANPIRVGGLRVA